jgi:chemotaxis protein methyltransferase CheR
MLENPEECGLLLDDITINVTHFFRDKEVFRLLEERVLPTLVYDKVVRGRKIIRLWSAGCASGEEAYSLAMLLSHVLGDRAGDYIVSVHGTDIDRQCLEHARQGEYQPRQVENVPPDMLEEYFEHSGGIFKVREKIREITKFTLQDLFSGFRTGHYDLISCRNVMIYFSRQMQQRLFSNFHDALNDRGYLVIGKTETLLEPARARFATVDVRERVFQKAR